MNQGDDKFFTIKDRIDVALREISFLQEIIARHEGHIMKVRGWMVLMAGGVLAAHFAPAVQVPKYSLGWVALVSSFAFLVLEMNYWQLSHRAILLVNNIEEKVKTLMGVACVNSGGSYEGPNIAGGMRSSSKKLKESIYNYFRRPWNIAYMFIVAIFVMVSFLIDDARGWRGSERHQQAPAGQMVGPGLMQEAGDAHE